MQIAILMSKMIFIKNLPSVRLTFCPKIKNAENLLKFRPIDTSKMPTSILMLKINFYEIFTNYQTHIRPKLKMLRVY